MATVVTSSAMVLTSSTLTLMTTKNKTHSKDFRLRMGLREKGKKRINKGEERRMWKGWYVNKRDFFL